MWPKQTTTTIPKMVITYANYLKKPSNRCSNNSNSLVSTITLSTTFRTSSKALITLNNLSWRLNKISSSPRCMRTYPKLERKIGYRSFSSLKIAKSNKTKMRVGLNINMNNNKMEITMTKCKIMKRRIRMIMLIKKKRNKSSKISHMSLTTNSNSKRPWFSRKITWITMKMMSRY